MCCYHVCMSFFHSILVAAILYVVFLPIPLAIKFSHVLDEPPKSDDDETCVAAIVPGTNRRV